MYQLQSLESQQRAVQTAWFYVLIGVSVIAMESTSTMSSANTGHWLLNLCNSLWGQADSSNFEDMHGVLRKCGHFFGYGILGLLFRHGWFRTMRARFVLSRSVRRFAAAILAVASTCGIALIDEWHQSLLPGRTSCFKDVMIDTAGAIALNLTLWFIVINRNNNLSSIYRRGTL